MVGSNKKLMHLKPAITRYPARLQACRLQVTYTFVKYDHCNEKELNIRDDRRVLFRVCWEGWARDFKVLNSIWLSILPLKPRNKVKEKKVHKLTWISRALASSPASRFLRGWVNSVSYLQTQYTREYEPKKRLDLQSSSPGKRKNVLASI